MATDTRAPKPLTIADLCQAIADHEVPYTVRAGEYELTALDLRRLQRESDAREDHGDVAVDALIAGEPLPSEMGSLT